VFGIGEKDEPVLREDDLQAWNTLQRTAAVRARTQAFLRRLDSARRVVLEELEHASNPMVAWSGGKDSTALAHLVVKECGKDVLLKSIKDDMDIPGEEEYVRRYAAEWGARLDVAYPPGSPWEHLKEAASKGEWKVDDDIHSASARLAKLFFYGILDDFNKGHDVVFLGLRAEESKARRIVRLKRGRAYTLKNGRRHCLPLADWNGLDVFAYLNRSGIEPMPCYKCCGLMHSREPWWLRVDWWVPGEHSREGGVVWLRRYYPSLYRKLCSITESARLLA